MTTLTAPNDFQLEISECDDIGELLERLKGCLQKTVESVTKMAAIVYRIEQLGGKVEIGRIQLILPELRLIARKQLSAEAFVNLGSHPRLLNKVRTLPFDKQEEIARDGHVKLMILKANDKFDHRMAPVLELTPDEVSRVFAKGRIRDDSEQVSLIRKAASVSPKPYIGPHVDDKMKALVIPASKTDTAMMLDQLELFVKQLRKLARK